MVAGLSATPTPWAAVGAARSGACPTAGPRRADSSETVPTPDWTLEAIYDRLEVNAPRIAIIGGSPDHPAHVMDPGTGARAALAGQAAAMYRSGGLAIADALLDRDPALVPGRVEMATVLVTRHAQLIEDAQVAGDAYRSVLGRVTRGYERAKELHEQARAATPGRHHTC